jgi:hypothetical protein
MQNRFYFFGLNTITLQAKPNLLVHWGFVCLFSFMGAGLAEGISKALAPLTNTIYQ